MATRPAARTLPATDEEYRDFFTFDLAPFPSRESAARALDPEPHYCDFIDCPCGRYAYANYDRVAMYGSEAAIDAEEAAIAAFEAQLSAI